MKRIIDKLFRTEQKGDNEKLSWKPRYFIILGLIGVLLLMISNLFSDDDEGQTNMAADEIEEQEAQTGKQTEAGFTSDIEQLARSYEQDLSTMLNKIQGVTESEVMVNLDSSDVKVYEKNLISGTQTTNEEDQNGGTRQVEDRTEDTQVVLVRQGDTETPILVQTKRPEIRGVFIVAKGAEQATVKSWIIEAVSSVLDVPSHRISVMPKD
ncbi:stage III sporulation protein AG [Oceanobacillus sp. FSL H7-0719]|uniref:stage III sporulation protein AG n=1 Tax=Oceanobacillus sp. FSL H7-0719 TaxID=2954507 RepID=UPI00324E6541